MIPFETILFYYDDDSSIPYLSVVSNDCPLCNNSVSNYKYSLWLDITLISRWNYPVSRFKSHLEKSVKSAPGY